MIAHTNTDMRTIAAKSGAAIAAHHDGTTAEWLVNRTDGIGASALRDARLYQIAGLSCAPEAKSKEALRAFPLRHLNQHW